MGLNNFITFVRRQERAVLLLGLVGVSLAVAVDIVFDLKDGLPLSHLFHEILILIFCFGLTLLQVRTISHQKQKIIANQKEIESLTNSRQEFQRKSLRFSQEFSEAVSKQFAEWNLTESERDVALLLIKGLSTKGIAEDRHSKDATVRQQAAAIYRKAGVEGRQELAAFFLEDLFSPIPRVD